MCVIGSTHIPGLTGFLLHGVTFSFDSQVQNFPLSFSQLIAESMTRVVSKYVSMRLLARFICISISNIRNLTKFCVNINIGFADILAYF